MREGAPLHLPELNGRKYVLQEECDETRGRILRELAETKKFAQAAANGVFEIRRDNTAHRERLKSLEDWEAAQKNERVQALQSELATLKGDKKQRISWAMTVVIGVTTAALAELVKHLL